MDKKIFIFGVLAGLVIFWTSGIKAEAQYYSTGGGLNPALVVDKLVSDDDKRYFDNIDKTTRVFVAGDRIYFKIILENSGQVDFSKVTVKDKLPDYLKLIYYPGVWNKSDNSLNWETGELGVGTTKTYVIAASIDPGNKEVKSTNFVEATANETSDNDRASYFLAKKLMPVTGPAGFGWQGMLAAAVGTAALIWRKLARGY